MSEVFHPFTGMWVTADGRIRHELLPGGRYDEARNGHAHAYQGSYRVSGRHIDYVDDSGFTADGDFIEDNVLHHAGMVLTRGTVAGRSTDGGSLPGKVVCDDAATERQTTGVGHHG